MRKSENQKTSIISDPPHGGEEGKLPKDKKDALLERVEGIHGEAERLHIYITLESIFKYDCGLIEAHQLGGFQRSLIEGDLMAWNKADSINRKYFDVIVKSIYNDMKGSNVRILARCRAILTRLVQDGKIKLEDAFPTGGLTSV